METEKQATPQGFDAYFEYKMGTSNKFYKITVVETDNGSATLTTRYGRIGTNGRVDTQTFHHYNLAVLHAEDLVDEKLRKGYKQVSALQALASACEEPHERNSNGLKPLEIAIPGWFVNVATAERLNAWAHKLLYKLNLIRASYYELSNTPGRAAENQAEKLFTQAREEIIRICGSTSNGPEMQKDPRTMQAAITFYNEITSLSGFRMHIFPLCDYHFQNNSSS
ncbi:MAG: WGR domain-containing protein [Nitrososphaera sp.]|nr:WGR domain-containing protein [Nitrososphaera sp.]